MNPASISACIAIGISLSAGLFGAWFAMISPKEAGKGRDTTVSILFAIAVCLMWLNLIAAALIAVRGTAYIPLLKAALLLTASFAVAGLTIGLLRGLRSAKSIQT